MDFSVTRMTVPQWNSGLIRGRYAKSGTNEPNLMRNGGKHNSRLERIFKAGADDYIVKPKGTDDLEVLCANRGALAAASWKSGFWLMCRRGPCVECAGDLWVRRCCRGLDRDRKARVGGF